MSKHCVHTGSIVLILYNACIGFDNFDNIDPETSIVQN